MIAVNIRNVDVLFHRDALSAEIVRLADAAAAVPRRVFVEIAHVVGCHAIRGFFHSCAVAIVKIICGCCSHSNARQPILDVVRERIAVRAT